MPATGYRTWCCTFRPSGGATDADIQNWKAYCNTKYTSGHLSGGFIVEEIVLDDDRSRHLHIGLCFKEARYKTNVKDSTKLAYKPRILSDNEQIVYQRGIKIWYNDDWFHSYCMKTFDSDEPLIDQCIWYQAWPTDAYPPPEDEQSKRALNPWFADRMAEYLERKLPLPAEEAGVRDFIDTLQFVDKSIVLIPDRTILKRKVIALRFYINGVIPKGYGHGLYLDDTDYDEIKMHVCDTCWKRRKLETIS